MDCQYSNLVKKDVILVLINGSNFENRFLFNAEPKNSRVNVMTSQTPHFHVPFWLIMNILVYLFYLCSSLGISLTKIK